MVQRIHFLIVDGLNLVRRVYAAQPGEDGPKRAEEARVASRQSLERALRETSPTHAVVVFEDSAPTWRHRESPLYKADHAPMPEALRAALTSIGEDFAAVGVPSIALPATEADDVAATFAVKCAAAGGTAQILSTDKMYLQLLGERIWVRDHFTPRDLDHAAVVEKFGVGPERLLDLLALTGDSTSGLPGVPGVGRKTAALLLGAFPDLEAVLAAAADPDADASVLTPRRTENLVAHADDARRTYRLLALRTDLDLGVHLSDLRYAG